MIYLGDRDPNLESCWMIRGVGLSSNIYLIGEAKITLIDSGVGNKANEILPHFRKLGLKLQGVERVILTHNHTDHISGLEEILKYSSPSIYIHSDDWDGVADFFSDWAVKKLRGGELLAGLRVVHTPGHTRGSICLYHQKSSSLFSGDTVFSDGSFGRTDLVGGNLKAMVNSLKALSSLRIKNLFPGHLGPAFGSGSAVVKAAYERVRSF